MKEKELRERVKLTFLMTREQKDILLNMKWDDNLLIELSNFFETYGKIEIDLVKNIMENKDKISTNVLHDIEYKVQGEVDKKDLENIEAILGIS